MKTFSQLTKTQKNKAVEHYTNLLLKEIVEGTVRFNDKLNKDDLQARIDKAWKKAEAMQTPWFVGEYIMDTCRDDIESLAEANAEDALYPEENESVCFAQIA